MVVVAIIDIGGGPGGGPGGPGGPGGGFGGPGDFSVLCFVLSS